MGDIAIVGGSLGGLYAGAELARAGRSVRLYERASGIRPLPRSLIVTGAYRDLLGDLGEPAVVAEINAFELLAAGQRVLVPLKRPDLIIERATLIRTLGEHARDSGVEVLSDYHFRDLSPRGAGVELRFHDREETAEATVVIGADGAHSRVARASGLEPPPVAPLMQALVKLPADLPADHARVWFRPQDTPYFYWLIPDSPTTGVLGIIGTEPARTRQLLDRFVARQGYEMLGYQGARIPEYDGWQRLHRKVGRGDVYLVGDAAGHVKVTTVGGVVNGIWGAAGVADRILGRGRRRLFSLRLELGLHLLIRRAMHRFGDDDYGALLRMLDESSQRCLGVYNRDETLRLMTNLLLRRPRFAVLGLRGLLSGAATGSQRRSAAAAATPS